MNRFFYLLLISMFFFPFCKTTEVTNAPKPMEQYNQIPEAPLLSALTIPVDIDVTEMVRAINTRMSATALYEDYSYTDNNNDGLMMNIWKSQDFTMFVSGNTIKYRVPLKLWMKKDLFMGAAAEAEGELALNFKTVFSVNPDWSLNTQTVVEYHEWISQPVLKTGLGKIGVETIANLALNRSKKTLSNTLDRYVNQQINLRPYLEEAWSSLQEPILLDSAYQMWVKTTPISIGMTPITTNWNSIQTRIAVECLNDVTFGQKPAFRANSMLPNLNLIQDAPDEFQIRIATDVPFEEASRMAKNIMIGQVFESGKKKVKVEDIELWGNNDKIVVRTQLSGSFKGSIYFIGRPQFNPKKNQIEVADLDFHLDTRSFLFRTASWIFQGPIKNQMKAAMTFPLDEDIKALKASVQESLNHYELATGIVLTGTIDSVTVDNTKITPNSIRVNLFTKGKVKVDVKGL